MTVFLDANGLDGPAVQHSEAEARFRRLGGAADGRVLMVAYTRGSSSNSVNGLRVNREQLRIAT